MTVRANGEWQGMNWIRQEKRLAIYLRDGLACAYCGDSIESGASLSLDHLKPASKGGSNHESNLVTCCERCNKSRGNRALGRWIKAVAGYLNHGITAKEIRAHVERCRDRKLTRYKKDAKAMIARRGSARKVLDNL